MLAGARFLQLQICFAPHLLEEFTAEAVRLGVTERAAVLPSITILRSARALRFIDEKVPGISVPADVIARVEAAEDQQEACFDVAYELAQHAMALPGRARPALHQLPQGRRDRRPLPAARDPHARRKG